MRGQVQGLFAFYVQFSLTNIIISNLLPLPTVILFHLQSSQQIALGLKLEHEFTYLAYVVEPPKATGWLEWVRLKNSGLISEDAWGQGVSLALWSQSKPGCCVQDRLLCTLERFAFGGHHVKAFLRSGWFFPSLWSWTRIKLVHVKASTAL